MIKLIKELWIIWVERAKLRRSLRILAQQEWSVDFLLYLVKKCESMSHKGYTITVRQGDKSLIVSSNMVAPPNVQNFVQREMDLQEAADQRTLAALQEML